MHRIDGGEALEHYPASSKVSTDGTLIHQLFDLGAESARRWLRRHFDDLGQKSTVNIRRDYIDDMQLGGIAPSSAK
jgi:NTE family protein